MLHLTKKCNGNEKERKNNQSHSFEERRKQEEVAHPRRKGLVTLCFRKLWMIRINRGSDFQKLI